jgi:predicted secreted protein
VPPTEAAAAGAPGGWGERFTAWADKAATGKLSPQLAKEGTELFDDLIDSKYEASVQASAMHAKGYKIPPANMPVMDREGNLTTLDKAPKAKPAAPTAKILTMSALQQAAKDHNVSIDEAKKQATAAGYTIQ